MSKKWLFLQYHYFLNLVILPDVYAEDQKAIWLEVTADGVPGSAPKQN